MYRMITPEMFDSLPKEEIFKALEIVEMIFEREQHMVDYYLSGDKDTRFEARYNVEEKHKLTYDQARETNKLDEFNKLVNAEFDRLVEYGDKAKSEGNVIRKFIANAKEGYKPEFLSEPESKPNTADSDSIEINNGNYDNLPF